MNKKKAKGAKLQNRRRYKPSKEVTDLKKEFYQWCFLKGLWPVKEISLEDLRVLYPGRIYE